MWEKKILRQNANPAAQLTEDRGTWVHTSRVLPREVGLVPGQERPHGSGARVLREGGEPGSGAGGTERRSEELTHLAPTCAGLEHRDLPSEASESPGVLVIIVTATL